MAKIGFIGTGTMGSAVASIVSKKAGDCQLLFSNRTEAKAEALANELLGAVSDNSSIAQSCDMIFLGVKPQMMRVVLSEIAPVLAEREEQFTLVSMAAGVTMRQIRSMAGGEYPVIRMMPNTPLCVGSGVVQYCGTVSQQHLRQFGLWMSGGGMVDLVPESMMDAATAVTGCGPAFCALFLEALADGGVLCGLPRDKAIQYAAKTMIGTAELLLQGEMSPSEIKDGVCSPGGSTIRGVAELEKNGFRSAGIQAVLKAYEGSKALGHQNT